MFVGKTIIGYTKMCSRKSSGSATVAFKEGKIHILKKGDVFYVGKAPHDSWVVGNNDYVSLHFIGADKYAN